MEEVKNKNFYFNNYIGIFFLTCFLLCMIYIFKSHKIVPICLIICGISNIVNIYFKQKLLITPISIFSLIWLILIPISSYQYPVMPEMTDFEWMIVLVFVICFCIGGLIASLMKKEIKTTGRRKLTTSSLKINFLVLCVSTLSLIMMFVKFGGIPLFYSDANVGKDMFRNSSFLNTLSYFGAISIIQFVMDDIRCFKNKKLIFLTIIYIILLILSAERYFVTIIFLLSLYSFCKIKINKEYLKKMLIIIIGILGIFIFVLQFRGNSKQKQIYFIDSGIYRGTSDELTRTEIFRYLGMQERILTKTFEIVQPGISKGTLTFSPLLKIVGIKPISIPDLQIYGYTSKSIITKLYCDFGYLWFLATILISLTINILFFNYKKQNSYINQYYTIMGLVFLTFSFYAYFDNFIIYYLHFPLYIIFIDILNKKGSINYENNNN